MTITPRRDHPGDEQIASLVDPASGGLPRAARQEIVRHLRRCPACARLVARLRDQLGQPPLDLGERDP